MTLMAAKLAMRTTSKDVEKMLSRSEVLAGGDSRGGGLTTHVHKITSTGDTTAV